MEPPLDFGLTVSAVFIANLASGLFAYVIWRIARSERLGMTEDEIPAWVKLAGAAVLIGMAVPIILAR